MDSLHVHSVPEHVFDVAAAPGQRFEFQMARDEAFTLETGLPNRQVQQGIKCVATQIWT